MAFDELLADRVRACLRQAAGVSEKKMFGGLAFMTGGHLTVGVYGDGLIARIGAQDMAAATAGPGVRPFDMTGRPMRGIVVDRPHRGSAGASPRCRSMPVSSVRAQAVHPDPANEPPTDDQEGLTAFWRSGL
jgi:TfoX N-terminal domain